MINFEVSIVPIIIFMDEHVVYYFLEKHLLPAYTSNPYILREKVGYDFGQADVGL